MSLYSHLESVNPVITKLNQFLKISCKCIFLKQLEHGYDTGCFAVSSQPTPWAVTVVCLNEKLHLITSFTYPLHPIQEQSKLLCCILCLSSITNEQHKADLTKPHKESEHAEGRKKSGCFLYSCFPSDTFSSELLWSWIQCVVTLLYWWHARKTNVFASWRSSAVYLKRVTVLK